MRVIYSWRCSGVLHAPGLRGLATRPAARTLGATRSYLTTHWCTGSVATGCQWVRVRAWTKVNTEPRQRHARLRAAVMCASGTRSRHRRLQPRPLLRFHHRRRRLCHHRSTPPLQRTTPQLMCTRSCAIRARTRLAYIVCMQRRIQRRSGLRRCFSPSSLC